MADKLNIINPYDSYQIAPQEEANGVYGNDLLSSVQSMQVGFGSSVLRVDRQGLWMGAADFVSAPFSVDMDGNMTATSLDLSNYLQVGDALGDLQADIVDLADIDTDLGTITAGTLIGLTVIGGVVKTSSSGARVEMNGTSDTLDIYDASAKRMSLDGDSLEFYNSSGSKTGEINANSGYSLVIDGSGSTAYTVLRYNSTYGFAVQANSSSVALFYSSGLAMQNSAAIRAYDIEAINTGADLGANGKPFGNGFFEYNVTIGRDLDVLDDLDVSDNVIVGGNLQLSSEGIGSDADPLANGIYDLGSSSKRWDYIYLVNSPDVSSDETTKENIEDIPSPLDKILKIRPIKFERAGHKAHSIKKEKTYKQSYFDKKNKKTTKTFKKVKSVDVKASPRTQQYGFSLQQMKTVLPEITSESGIRYMDVIGILVGAVQELEAKVKTLESKQ